MNRMNTLLAALAPAALLVAAPAAAQTPTRVGVIEVQRIVQDSAMGKESLARVQKAQAGKQDELAKRQKELRDMEQKIQEQNKTLSEDALEKLNKDYQSRALEMKRFQDDAQRELEELQRRELGELEKKVMPVIQQVSKEEGYQLVFNKFQSGLLYADEAVDLTDKVITKFNSALATAPAKPEAKPAAPAGAAKPTPKAN